LEIENKIMKNMCHNTIKLVSLLTIFGGMVLNSQRAQAEANLTFSGGNGTPLTMTLTEPVTYTITSTVAATQLGFAFQGVGNVLGNTTLGVNSTLVYAINGGAPIAISFMTSGATSGDLANTTYMFSAGTAPSISLGDTVLLSAGAVTTMSNVTAAAPANGSYPTFIYNRNGTRISSFGTSAVTAPEPGTLALLAIGGVGFVSRLRRGRK
jgi:hypothetical protein